MPADLPASSRTHGYTSSRPASCGVSASLNTPLVGVPSRLSPQAAYDDWDPGRLGSRVTRLQQLCQNKRIENFLILFCFLNLNTLDILDNFGQCPNVQPISQHPLSSPGLDETQPLRNLLSTREARLTSLGCTRFLSSFKPSRPVNANSRSHAIYL